MTKCNAGKRLPEFKIQSQCFNLNEKSAIMCGTKHLTGRSKVTPLSGGYAFFWHAGDRKSDATQHGGNSLKQLCLRSTSQGPFVRRRIRCGSTVVGKKTATLPSDVKTCGLVIAGNLQTAFEVNSVRMWLYRSVVGKKKCCCFAPRSVALHSTTSHISTVCCATTVYNVPFLPNICSRVYCPFAKNVFF